MRHICTNSDKTRMFQILENSFIKSPGMKWMFKNKEALHSLKSLLNYLFEEANARDGAYITSDNNGVVFFYRLDRKVFSLRIFFKALYLFLFVFGLKNGLLVIRYRKKVASIRPKKGYVGFLVATDNSVVGNNAAYEIKNEMFRIADENNESIYLETTSPRVRLLYKKAGYIEYHEMKHPYAPLTIWFFRRDPRSI